MPKQKRLGNKGAVSALCMIMAFISLCFARMNAAPLLVFALAWHLLSIKSDNGGVLLLSPSWRMLLSVVYCCSGDMIAGQVFFTIKEGV